MLAARRMVRLRPDSSFDFRRAILSHAVITMKTLSILLTALLSIGVLAHAEDAKKPKPAPAAKKPAAKKPVVKTDMVDEESVGVIKPYDKDGNFEIDLDEFKAVEADFKKNPKGPLKQFDKGKDGSVDAMIDRTGMNVKLGGAAPKKAAAPAKKPVAKKPAAKKPAPKKPEEKKPAS